MTWIPRGADNRVTTIAVSLLTLAVVPGLSGQENDGPAIADNSFLIEEAYNQEPGVVQHISTFTVAGSSGRDLFYTLTQEWPFHGQRHQLSFTLPVTRLEGQGSGVGDVLLNYRLQLGGGDRPWALAPRLSAILPTGRVDEGRGDGSVGVQVNLPLSYALSRDVVTHWNAGATLLPSAEGPRTGGKRPERTLTSYNLGGSIIAPARMPLQLMLESVVLFESEITGGGGIDRSTAWILNPGVRAAINLGSLQIVPGLSVPLTRSAGDTESDLFLYLSFEHPFRAQASDATE